MPIQEKYAELMPSSSECCAFTAAEPSGAPSSIAAEAAAACLGLYRGDEDESGPPHVYNRRPVLPLKPPASSRTFTLSTFGRQLRYGDGNPGPGAYSSPSAFGPQVLSNQKSTSSADFSRSTRDEQNKVYVSAEFDENKYGVGSPGPTVCDNSSSLGNQITAPFKSAPKFRFGVEKRFKHVDNKCSPGVGKYGIISSFGKQNDSRKKNLPSFSFCHSNRDQQAKVFISAIHDRTRYGETSPGPGATLKAHRSLGEKQVDSRMVTCNASRFGNAPRFKDYHSGIPGPGKYNC